MLQWLASAAEAATDNPGLASEFLGAMRSRRIIVPDPMTVERVCADAWSSISRFV